MSHWPVILMVPSTAVGRLLFLWMNVGNIKCKLTFSQLFTALANDSLVLNSLTDVLFSCTSVLAAHKRLTVSDETASSMRVSWVAAPGRVSHYRLRYVPSSGGREVSLKVPGTSTLLQRLRPLTSYNITVHPIYKRGEGKARQGVGTTRTLVHHSTSLTETSTLTPPSTH